MMRYVGASRCPRRIWTDPRKLDAWRYPVGKYSDQKKIAAAADYCGGHLGLRATARRHGVNVASLRLWAAAYRVHGAAGVRSKERRFYTVQFKLRVLQRMQTDKLSHRQVAALFDIRRRDI